MTVRNFKTSILVIEGFNAIATTLYFYYLYFFMQEKFGFGAVANLTLAAVLGLVNAIAAFYGGRFAQRHSCMTSLRVGFLIMSSILFAGSQLDSLAAHVVVAIVAITGMCFTWPALQALVSEKEPPNSLQKYVGFYNFTWASGSAIAYFSGGAMIEALGLRSVLLIPALIHLLQFATTFFLKPSGSPAADNVQHSAAAKPPRNAGLFLKMAWVANPFAYLAINTIIAINPTLAKHLNLSGKWAGIVCSVWFFVRAASFVLLWLWPKWHYRFRWLIGAYVGLLTSFAAILLFPVLWVLILAQIVFGLSVGLIYYSSLFYSMDASESKAASGGIHEAAIGAGCCAGPAIGATALHFFPHQPNSGTMAVSFLLVCGFGSLLWLRSRRVSALATN
jgi:MFS family permease